MDALEMVASAVRLLAIDGDSPRPVMQILLLGPLRSRSVKENGHGPALLEHQAVKSLGHPLNESVVIKGHGVVEVQHRVGWFIHMVRPMSGRCTMKHRQTWLIEHGAANVANQVLNFERSFIFGPSQQSSFIQCTDGRGARHHLRRKRSGKQHHAVHRFKRFIVQPVEHGLFNKGLNVFTGFRKLVSLSVEIERHRVPIERFCDFKAKLLIEMVTQNRCCVTGVERAKFEQRPIKAIGKRKATRDDQLVLPLVKTCKQGANTLEVAWLKQVKVVNNKDVFALLVDVFNHGFGVNRMQSRVREPGLDNGLSIAQFVHRGPTNRLR